jgi:hypothetical protein
MYMQSGSASNPLAAYIRQQFNESLNALLGQVYQYKCSPITSLILAILIYSIYSLYLLVLFICFYFLFIYFFSWYWLYSLLFTGVPHSICYFQLHELESVVMVWLQDVYDRILSKLLFTFANDK